MADTVRRKEPLFAELHLDEKSVMTDNDFRFSRIQAEGWNAARRIPVAHLAALNGATIAALNPYSKEPERVRWHTGFESALKSWQR